MNPYEVTIEGQDLLDSFDIWQTMESGQHFRHYVLDQKIYFVYDKGVYYIEETDQGIYLWGSQPFAYMDFFDLNRDYMVIQKRLMEKDKYLRAAIKQFGGVRILRQDPFEMIVTFIISQSKQIPQIKVLVERLATTYGTYIGQSPIGDHYAFPKPEDLKVVTEETYRDMKLGYRAPYLVDCVHKIISGQLDLEALYDMDYHEAQKALMTIKGVGTKVADCVLLFAYGKFDAFPVDTWVKKIVTAYYFDSPPTDKVLKAFVKDYFDDNPGLAQQYLFEYARISKL